MTSSPLRHIPRSQANRASPECHPSRASRAIRVHLRNPVIRSRVIHHSLLSAHSRTCSRSAASADALLRERHNPRTHGPPVGTSPACAVAGASAVRGRYAAGSAR